MCSPPCFATCTKRALPGYDAGIPIWVDERGPRRPTRRCFRCDREVPELRLRYEHLRANGWKPCKLFFVMNWCGHGIEYQPWLQADGWWLLVPVLGEA
jgi:hypothetical protein